MSHINYISIEISVQLVPTACYQTQFGIRYTSELHEGKLSAIVLVVSPLVSLMIAKVISLSERCFWNERILFLNTHLVRILFNVDKLHEHYNFTEIYQKWPCIAIFSLVRCCGCYLIENIVVAATTKYQEPVNFSRNLHFERIAI